MQHTCITTPLTNEQLKSLRAGEQVRITGTIYTARDAAHARLVQAIENGQPLPMDLRGALLYYAGPTPAKPGRAVGSLGPTTSGRMDAYAPALLAHGLKGMMGKGPRSQAVKDAVVQHGAVYLAALGGAGALLSEHVKKREVVAYPELQSEAVARLEVEDFPAIVALDWQGNDYYALGPAQYRAQQEAQKQ